MYYLTVSVSHESGHGLTWFSAYGITGYSQGVSQGWLSSEGLTGEGSASPTTHVVKPFLAVIELRALVSLRAVGSGGPSAPPEGSPTIPAMCHSSQQGRDSSQMDSTVLYDTNLGVKLKTKNTHPPS